MKGTRLLSVFVCLCVSAAVISCNRRDEPEALVPGDYTSWVGTTDTELDYPIPGHANTVRRIYINETGRNVEVRQDGNENLYRYPPGTIIVKEIYESEPGSPSAAPTRLTVMVKDPDHEAASGGWVWLMKDPESGAEEVQRTAFCVSCHNNANEPHPYGDRNVQGEFRDFVFFPYRANDG